MIGIICVLGSYGFEQNVNANDTVSDVNLIGEIYSPKPEDTSWVKISLPAQIIYWSTKTSNHKVITSGEHRIDNQSAYPIRVLLSGYNENGQFIPETTGIDELTLTGLKSPISLVKSGKAKMFKKKRSKISLIDLGTGKAKDSKENFMKSNTVSFELSGVTKFSFEPEALRLNNNLTFEIIPLNKDGGI